jgi:hypothetical protein
VPDTRIPRKRVVLHQADGVYRIVGMFDDSIHEVRPEVEYRYAGRPDVVKAGLALVADRFILYREILSARP